VLLLGISTPTNWGLEGDSAVICEVLGWFGDDEAPTLNLREILGFFASSSLRLQSAQMKWKSSFSAADFEIPKHLLCCQTLHLSQATL
jgi:hypothetical protein